MDVHRPLAGHRLASRRLSFQPDALFERLLARPRPLRFALLCLVAVATAYAFAILLLALGGGESGMEPWLTIPRSTYFYWEATFTMPVIIGTTLLTAVCVYLTARALGATGSFDNTLAAISFATAIGTLFSLIPDAIEGMLTTLGLVDGAKWSDSLTYPSGPFYFLWTYLALYTLAFLILYPAAVRQSLGLRGLRSYAVGWPAFALYQGILFIFIR